MKRKEFSINIQGLRRHTTQYDPIQATRRDQLRAMIQLDNANTPVAR